MKVLLVRPKYSSILVNLEPLGLEYVGGMLNNIHIPYEIFDEFNLSGMFLFSKLIHKIKSKDFTHVGFHVNANSVDYCFIQGYSSEHGGKVRTIQSEAADGK